MLLFANNKAAFLHIAVAVTGLVVGYKPTPDTLRGCTCFLAAILVIECIFIAIQIWFPVKYYSSMAYCDLLAELGRCLPMTQEFYWLIFFPMQVIWVFLVAWLLLHIKLLGKSLAKRETLFV
eukprot:GEMP01094862.1.p1 GENE.GEMP01094862.1~~GEMP01094862.1.p1  ORF type:complete len:122 (+),score=12.53 GEMP01094862.1:204-569(+)